MALKALPKPQVLDGFGSFVNFPIGCLFGYPLLTPHTHQMSMTWYLKFFGGVTQESTVFPRFCCCSAILWCLMCILASQQGLDDMFEGNLHSFLVCRRFPRDLQILSFACLLTLKQYLLYDKARCVGWFFPVHR